MNPVTPIKSNADFVLFHRLSERFLKHIYTLYQVSSGVLDPTFPITCFNDAPYPEKKTTGQTGKHIPVGTAKLLIIRLLFVFK